MREIKLAQRGIAYCLLGACIYGPCERLTAAVTTQKPLEWCLFWIAVSVVSAVAFVVAPVAGGASDKDN